jgi:hypothetical protein
MMRSLQFKPRFSLRTLLIIVSFLAFLAAWLARAERQRTAVAELRELSPRIEVFYYLGGPCASIFSEGDPWRTGHIAGIDLLRSVRTVFVDAEVLDAAAPNLSRLSWLTEIYISTDKTDEEAATARMLRAVQRGRKRFPKITVEEHPGCPILFTRIPVVG